MCIRDRAEALDLLGPDARKVAGVVLNKVALDWHRLFADRRYVGYLDDPADMHEPARIPA